MHKLITTMALALAVSIASMASVHAQTTGDESQSGNKGGTTGIMTTTPEAKTDDAVGTRGGAAPTVATPGGLESGAPHGCTATQMWDPTKKICVNQ
jgi:hypothetical protein